MTYYVSSGTLNPTHSLSLPFAYLPCPQFFLLKSSQGIWTGTRYKMRSYCLHSDVYLSDWRTKPSACDADARRSVEVERWRARFDGFGSETKHRHTLPPGLPVSCLQKIPALCHDFQDPENVFSKTLHTARVRLNLLFAASTHHPRPTHLTKCTAHKRCNIHTQYIWNAKYFEIYCHFVSVPKPGSMHVGEYEPQLYSSTFQDPTF